MITMKLSPCSHIEATVENEFTFDKLGFGNCQMRFYYYGNCDDDNMR